MQIVYGMLKNNEYSVTKYIYVDGQSYLIKDWCFDDFLGKFMFVCFQYFFSQL